MKTDNQYALYERLVKTEAEEYDEENATTDEVDFDKEFFKVGKAFDTNFTEEDADPDELNLGMETEKDHTTSDEIAKKIVLDHLAEIPDYYTKLKAMVEEIKSSDNSEEDDEPETDEPDTLDNSNDSNNSDDEIEEPETKTPKKEENFKFESLKIQKDLEFVDEDKYVGVIKKVFKEAKDYKSFLVDVDVNAKKFKTVYGCKEKVPNGKSSFIKIL